MLSVWRLEQECLNNDVATLAFNHNLSWRHLNIFKHQVEVPVFYCYGMVERQGFTVTGELLYCDNLIEGTVHAGLNLQCNGLHL